MSEMAMTKLSPSSDEILLKEAGRELAAFLRAVEETQGAETAEKAGTIWIDILRNRPHLDFCSQSSFRSISVEAAGSLVSLMGAASHETFEAMNDEADCIDHGRIHLVPKPAEWEMSAQYATGRRLLFEGKSRRSGESEGLGLVS